VHQALQHPDVIPNAVAAAAHLLHLPEQASHMVRESGGVLLLVLQPLLRVQSRSLLRSQARRKGLDFVHQGLHLLPGHPFCA
jgi:hypothetical protein